MDTTLPSSAPRLVLEERDGTTAEGVEAPGLSATLPPSSPMLGDESRDGALVEQFAEAGPEAASPASNDRQQRDAVVTQRLEETALAATLPPDSTQKVCA